MLLNCGVGEDSWESLGLQGDPTSPTERRPVLGVPWKDWFWGWNSNTLATWCEESTHWKRPWCWEGLRVGGEGDDRGWDGWMASPTWCTWVWVNSGSWWWTGRPGVLQFMGSQRLGHNWATELNWTGYPISPLFISYVDLTKAHHLVHENYLFYHFEIYALIHTHTGEGNGSPLQCSCLENPRDGGAWWAAVMGSHRAGHDWSDLA